MATFSKRHYEAIAAACARARKHSTQMSHETFGMYTSRLEGIGMLQAEISQMFAEDNQRFDGERFAPASGMRGSL